MSENETSPRASWTYLRDLRERLNIDIDIDIDNIDIDILGTKIIQDC